MYVCMYVQVCMYVMYVCTTCTRVPVPTTTTTVVLLPVPGTVCTTISQLPDQNTYFWTGAHAAYTVSGGSACFTNKTQNSSKLTP